MTRIFINYRRSDSAPYAGRLYDRLQHDLGGNAVFMDIDHIEPGDDWVQVIEDRLADCAAVLALIGPGWALCADPAGRRRLDSPIDQVRRELAVALQRGIRVVPVLVGGAEMPNPESLPEDLAPLARRNAIELSDQRFHHDADRLLRVLRRTLGEAPHARGTEPPAPQPAESPVLEPSSPPPAADARLTFAPDTRFNADGTLRGHRKQIGCVAFSLDGAALASAGGGEFFGGDTEVRLWDLRARRLRLELPGHSGHVTGVAFSPDATLLASCSSDAVRLWRVADGRHLLTIEEEFGDQVEFSADGRELLSGAAIHRVDDGTVVHKLGSSDSAARRDHRYRLLPGGGRYAVLTRNEIQVRRIADGQVLGERPLLPKLDHLYTLTASPDGRLLAASWHQGGNRIALIEADSGLLRWTTGTDGGILKLCFDPALRVLAGLSMGGDCIDFWRLADGAFMQALKIPETRLLLPNGADSLAFSPDGGVLAAGCRDAQLHLWTVRSAAPG